MLRQLILLATDGRVIESIQTLPFSVDRVFTPIPVGAAFALTAIVEDDHQAFHESLGLARAASFAKIKVGHVGAFPMDLDIRWSTALDGYLVLASTHGVARNLTDRQTRVLRLLCEDKTLGEIADELGIKVTTVQTYASRLRERASVSTNHGLAIWALKNGKV